MSFSCWRFRSIQQHHWMKGATWSFCSAEVSEIPRHEAPCGFGLGEREGKSWCQPLVFPWLLEPCEDVTHLVLSHLALSRGSFESKVCKEEPGINSS